MFVGVHSETHTHTHTHVKPSNAATLWVWVWHSKWRKQTAQTEDFHAERVWLRVCASVLVCVGVCVYGIFLRNFATHIHIYTHISWTQPCKICRH